jgi:hypothetical protein
MSGCALRRWGPGTTADRPPNTEAARQLDGGVAAMMAARQAQDCKYFPSEAVASEPAAKATHADPQLGGKQMLRHHN